MKKLISIISPTFNKEGCVEELSNLIKSVFSTEENYEFESIIVDNCSTDSTYEKLLQIKKKICDSKS
jgi:glycosyltransferase involved in cell wall biosynthesis